MSLRAKLRLENLESRPRIDPMLPPIVVWEMDAAPERLVIGMPPVAIKESRGLSSDRLSPPASPGPEETPLKPCRARWARCLCRGVCLFCGNCSTEPLSLVEREDKGDNAGELYAGPTWTGIKPSCGRLKPLFSTMELREAKSLTSVHGGPAVDVHRHVEILEMVPGVEKERVHQAPNAESLPRSSCGKISQVYCGMIPSRVDTADRAAEDNSQSCGPSEREWVF